MTTYLNAIFQMETMKLPYEINTRPFFSTHQESTAPEFTALVCQQPAALSICAYESDSDQ